MLVTRALWFVCCVAAVAASAFAQAPTIMGMGYLYPPVAVAPGQLITVFLAGAAQGDVSASVAGLAAPVLEIRPASGCASSPLCSNLTALTIQIPYGLEPACDFTNPACNVVLAAELTIAVNGVASAPLSLIPLSDRVHLLTACDTAVPGGSGSASVTGIPCAPLVTHADGSLVTAGNPAAAGEELVAYAVGLGLTSPLVPTGQAVSAATPTYETFLLDFNFRPNALATQPLAPAPTPLYSGLAPGYPGLYQVNFTVPAPPAGLPSCSAKIVSNLTVSVGGETFDGAGICVAP